MGLGAVIGGTLGAIVAGTLVLAVLVRYLLTSRGRTLDIFEAASRSFGATLVHTRSHMGETVPGLDRHLRFEGYDGARRVAFRLQQDDGQTLVTVRVGCRLARPSDKVLIADADRFETVCACFAMDGQRRESPLGLSYMGSPALLEDRRVGRQLADLKRRAGTLALRVSPGELEWRLSFDTVALPHRRPDLSSSRSVVTFLHSLVRLAEACEAASAARAGTSGISGPRRLATSAHSA